MSGLDCTGWIIAAALAGFIFGVYVSVRGLTDKDKK